MALNLIIEKRDHEVTAVVMNGQQVSAQVYDYDVDFPVVAAGIEQDIHGDWYKKVIV